jgi:DNA-binding response OmpR family regulator/nitrogen-specific signal transduction histidine kinase
MNRLKMRNELKMKNFEAQKLQEVDHLKSRFFANISHEFRTPLTLILGPLEDVIAKVRDKAVKEELRMMERNAARLLRLINQLLDLSRLESGRMALHASRGDFIAFLKGIVMSFASLAEQQKITLRFETGAALANGLPLAIYFDRDKIEKIFYNLLSNAFKFTPEGGEVSVQLSVTSNQLQHNQLITDHWLLITVKDTGIGIPAGELPRIFDRFYQVDSASTREYEGSGLGLALTKELAEQHYGEIEAHSEEGMGSEFIVRLPLGKEHLQPEEIVEEAEPSSVSSEQLPVVSEQFATTSIESERSGEPDPGLRRASLAGQPATPMGVASDQQQATSDQPIILVVDDHPDVRNYIRKHLEPDYHVTEAKDGQEGVDVAREAVPDLVISDVMMPRLDGYQLCAALKTNEKTSHIPVILLTAKAGEENKLAGLEIGADDYLIKPFSAKELQARAKNLIALRRKLREHLRREGLLRPHEVAVPSVEEVFLRKLMQVTEQHLGDEGFDLEALRRELNMEQKQLYRKIKALTGQTPTEFIRTIRLRHAKQLLEQHAGTVSEIAFQVGFNNLSYFSKCFREEFGQLPSELAKS